MKKGVDICGINNCYSNENISFKTSNDIFVCPSCAKQLQAKQDPVKKIYEEQYKMTMTWDKFKLESYFAI